MTTVLGRRWRLVLLWYGEAALAAASIWALAYGRGWQAALAATAYLLLCGAALILPGHVLRALATRVEAGPRARLSVLQAFFALSAAATAAALSTANVPLAVVCGLLLADALWALELESRARHRGACEPARRQVDGPVADGDPQAGK